MSLPLATDFLALQEALAGRYSLERELGRGGMGIGQRIRNRGPLPASEATRILREVS